MIIQEENALLTHSELQELIDTVNDDVKAEQARKFYPSSRGFREHFLVEFFSVESNIFRHSCETL